MASRRSAAAHPVIAQHIPSASRRADIDAAIHPLRQWENCSTTMSDTKSDLPLSRYILCQVTQKPCVICVHKYIRGLSP